MIPAYFGSVVQICCGVVGITWSYKILNHEYVFRSSKESLILPKRLDYAFITMLILIYAYLLFQSIIPLIPILCYNYKLSVIGPQLLAMVKLSISWFQLERLQFCFSDSGTQKINRYSYKCHIFILLKIYIIITVCYGIYSLIFLSNVELIGWWCLSDVFLQDLMLWIGVLMVLMVDWTILFLYFYKINQFKKLIEIDNVKLRLQFILNKIFILSIIMEIPFVSYTFLMSFVSLEYFIGPYLYGVGLIMIMFDCIFNIYIVLLMYEHHNDKYIYLIEQWDYCISNKCCINFSIPFKINTLDMLNRQRSIIDHDNEQKQVNNELTQTYYNESNISAIKYIDCEPETTVL
eukprot:401094_1